MKIMLMNCITQLSKGYFSFGNPTWLQGQSTLSGWIEFQTFSLKSYIYVMELLIERNFPYITFQKVCVCCRS